MERKIKNNWPKQSSYCNHDEDLSILQREMKRYMQEKTKTVRTARHFLRAVGLEINSNGYLLSGGKTITLPKDYAIFGK